MLITIDGFENLTGNNPTEEQKELIHFLEFLSSISEIKIIISGQRVNLSSLKTDPFEIRLSGLEEQEASKILKDIEIIETESGLQQIFQVTRGYPENLLWFSNAVNTLISITKGEFTAEDYNKKGNNSGVIENIESKNDKVISTDISSSTVSKLIDKDTQVELVNITLFDGKVKIDMPEDFKLMTEEVAKLKYPSEQRPQIIYTNKESTVNVAFSSSNQEFIESDLSKLSEYYKDTLLKGIDIEQNEIRTINGNKILFISFISDAPDTKIYNLLGSTVLDGKLFILNFNIEF